MESVNKRVVLITMILAVLTTIVVYSFIKKQTKIEQEGIKKTIIYVAVKDIPAKHEILEMDVKKVEIEKEYINKNALNDINEIVGKRTTESILKGEQILKGRLVEDKELSLSFNIPLDKRAVTINIDEQKGVAYLIKPGDYVDIIATVKKTEEGSIKTTNADGTTAATTVLQNITTSKSKIILQRIKVLATGQDIGDKMEESTDAKNKPKTVTLEVTPEESEKVVAASEFATIRLLLRHSDNEDMVKTNGVGLNDLHR